MKRCGVLALVIAASLGLIVSAAQAQGGEQTTSRLVVEEYPIVSAAEDTPDHFEFKQRIADQILDVRRDWREPDAAAKIAATNAIISQWDYKLKPLPEGGSALYSISHFGSVLFPDVTRVYPIAVNDSGTDFRLLIETLGQSGPLVVTPVNIGKLDLTNFVYLAPVYAGSDLIEVAADWNNNQFQVLRNGEVIYTYVPEGMFVEPPVHGLWSWQGQWVLEVEGDVIIDGASAKAEQGYDEMFGWQVIAGQPFFFFKKTDFLTQKSTFGMSYAGQEIEPYRYQEVIHYRCCEGSMFNISGNGTMVWFYALRDGMWYYVEAGVY